LAIAGKPKLTPPPQVSWGWVQIGFVALAQEGALSEGAVMLLRVMLPGSISPPPDTNPLIPNAKKINQAQVNNAVSQ